MEIEKYSARWLLNNIIENEDNPAKQLLLIIEFQSKLQESNNSQIEKLKADNKRSDILLKEKHFEECKLREENTQLKEKLKEKATCLIHNPIQDKQINGIMWYKCETCGKSL